MEQYYKVAGLRVRMDSFGRIIEQAKPYLCDSFDEADIVIQCESATKAFKEKHSHLTLEECEYLCSGASFYRQLLKHDGMLIHASAVAMDGYAYLFSAPCGTGKSTHTSMWRKAFGEDKVKMLNDDKPALRKEDGRWYAYGTPWSGKTAQNINMRVPLGGVCVLTRGATNEIKPLSGPSAIFALLEQTIRPADVETRGKLLGLLDDLLTSVPVWKMSCTPTVEAAMCSHEAMSEAAYKKFSDMVAVKEV